MSSTSSSHSQARAHCFAASGVSLLAVAAVIDNLPVASLLSSVVAVNAAALAAFAVQLHALGLVFVAYTVIYPYCSFPRACDAIFFYSAHLDLGARVIAAAVPLFECTASHTKCVAFLSQLAAAAYLTTVLTAACGTAGCCSTCTSCCALIERFMPAACSSSSASSASAGDAAAVPKSASRSRVAAVKDAASPARKAASPKRAASPSRRRSKDE